MTVTTAPVRPAVAPETVTPLRPSEALKLGRLTRPRRITGQFFEGTDGACALGAMSVAIGLGPDGPKGDEGDYGGLASRWPRLSDPAPLCPARPARATCDMSEDVVDVIYHLNDSAHDWSDAQIIAWLESINL